MKRKTVRAILKFIKRPSLICFLGLATVVFWEYWGKDMGMKEYLGREDIRVVDGDTIVANGEKIRLKGMDAPESKQKCSYGEKQQIKYLCGKEATNHLRKIIADQSLECTDEGKDLYGRTLSYCYVDGANINRKMVLDGWAVSYNKEFLAEELIARSGKKGMWKGEFEDPKQWRKNNKSKNKQKYKRNG